MNRSKPMRWLTAMTFAAVWQPAFAAGPAPAAAPAPATAKAEAPTANVSQITQAALNAGVVSCVPRINQVSNFVASGGERSGAYLFLPETQRDQMLIGASYGVLTKDARPIYVGAAFAPNQANGCGAEYESVVYWDEACEQVADKRYAGLRKTGELVKSMQMLDGGRNLKVFLMRAGKGCVSIKREVVN